MGKQGICKQWRRAAWVDLFWDRISSITNENKKFCAHGSVHRESTLKCSNKMTLFVQYFIPCKQPYMFRVKQSPIIRSSNKHLVVTDNMWPSVVVSSDSSTTTAGHLLFVTTRCCKYSLFELLMMGECFTRNMLSCLQGIKYCTKSVILLEHFKVENKKNF
jgi:hypothetical protein